MKTKNILLGAAAVALLALQIGPSAIAGYNGPANYGPVSGDCTTPSSVSAVITCTKTNGTTFGTMSTQAASGVAITGGSVSGVSASTTTLSASGTATFSAGQVVSVFTLTSGASYTALNSNFIIDVNKGTGSATAITLPSSPVNGQTVYVKDKKGDAGTNNITVTPATGTIDGASSYVENQAYQNVMFVYDSSAASWGAY